MYDISADIKSQQFKNIYVFYGDEDYLITQYRDRILKALSADLDSMNVNIFNADAPDMTEVSSVMETLPFFADRRVVVINSRSVLAESNEDLCKAIETIPETTYLLIATSKVNLKTKLGKLINEKAAMVECSMPNEVQLKKWIGSVLKREGLMMKNEAADLFLQYTGSDMRNMSTELEKLICYCMGREVVEKADVEAVCVRRITNHIFDMIEAMGSHNTQRAMDLYYDLLSLKEPPMRILALLGRHFNQLLSVRELRNKGFKQNEIAEKMGLKDFIVRKLLSQAADFEEEVLRAAVEDCVKADEDVKVGRVNDQLSVEMILIRYSRSGK